MAVQGFGIEKEFLKHLLVEVEQGKTQLPDFQRSWVWAWEDIAELIASISLGYPAGALMMLRAGGAVRFKTRPVEGAPPCLDEPQRLVLDGQQRLTSLYQALQREEPVRTRDQRGRSITGWFYIDMEHALAEPRDRINAIKFVPEDRVKRDRHGKPVLDMSSADLEYQNRMFPCTKLLCANDWVTDLLGRWHGSEDFTAFFDLWKRFANEVITPFAEYQLPVIELNRDTDREAVCQVFERVNTGGVTLTVFELLTATYAADDFELRTDWEQRCKQWADPRYRVLHEVSETDFLQAVTLLSTYHRKAAETEIRHRANCRRSDILALPLTEYRQWAPHVTEGLRRAARFLHEQHLFDAKFLPYGSQLIPLAAIYAVLDKDAETTKALELLARWYWCGVFGELYGTTTETRFAQDLPEMVDWIRADGGEPRTVAEAQFFASRLHSMKTRNSAAYKGLYALLLGNGAADWASGKTMSSDIYFDEAVDIHHIFPQKWCADRGIPPQEYNSILNKAPLSARTNRIIGGQAPSKYLALLERHSGASESTMDSLIGGHGIDPQLLRSDEFTGTTISREGFLLRLISQAMGKDTQWDLDT